MQSCERTTLDPQHPPLALEESSTTIFTEEQSNSDSRHDQLKRNRVSEDGADEQQLKKKFRKGHGSDDIIDKIHNLTQMSEANDDGELYGRQIAATL